MKKKKSMICSIRSIRFDFFFLPPAAPPSFSPWFLFKIAFSLACGLWLHFLFEEGVWIIIIIID